MPERFFAFISYAGVHRDWVAALQRDLERCLEHYARTVDPSIPQHVFLDQIDLQSGRTWIDQFQEAVETSERLILIVSPEALASEWVRVEWQSFFTRRPRDVFPISLSRADLPAFLEPIHRLDFEGLTGAAYNTRLQQLLGDLLRRSRRDPPPMPPGLEPAPGPASPVHLGNAEHEPRRAQPASSFRPRAFPASRRRLLLLLAMVMLVALVAGRWPEAARFGPTGAPPGTPDTSPPSPLLSEATPQRAPPLPPHCREAQEKTGIELVWVPGGAYTLGSETIDRHATPVHTVELSPFWIGKHPVTNAQYGRFLAATEHPYPEYWLDGRFNTPSQPLVGVSWTQASRFVFWSDLALPTEAQWEAAARGFEARSFPWGNGSPSTTLADFGQGRVRGRPDPVGSYPAGVGPFGAEEQAGSVWEWCRDAWNPEAYADRHGTLDPIVLPPEPADEVNTHYVLRGGSWHSPPEDLHSARRFKGRANGQSRGVGFRVVCETKKG